MLRSKILKKKHTIAIIGLGYVGLPLAIRFIKKKVKVLGIDSDLKKIKMLKEGKSYIRSISNTELKYFKKNKSLVTNNYRFIQKCDVIIICLPTPLKLNNYPDMRYVFNCAKKINKYLNSEKLIILESTVYPGASEDFLKNIKAHKKNIYFSYSPERENPGDRSFSYKKTPKVLGGKTKLCTILANLIYKPIVKKIYVTESLRVAEMSKLLENIYRSVNIALVNEMKIIADKFGINIYEVIKAAATKNFGFVRFNPGPGYGGHCIPIDPIYLSWASKKLGYKAKFIETATNVNNLMPMWIYKKISNYFKASKRKLIKILIFGISYKKNVDDDRESPSYYFMKILKKNKIYFDYYDPYFLKLRKGRNNNFNKSSIEFLKKTVSKYDCSVIMTDHDNFNYKKILNFSKLIFDCRGKFNQLNIKSNKIIDC